MGIHKNLYERNSRWNEFEISANPLPVRVIAIETSGSCNRSCGYCPVSSSERRIGLLDTELVQSLIGQLSAVDYTGKFTFHFYNEPLLDKRIFSFVEYAHLHIPKAKKLLTTNGDYLDSDKLNLLLSNSFNVAISAHDQRVYEKALKLKASASEELRCNINIRPYFRVGDGTKVARVTNRGGSIDLSSYSVDEVQEADDKGCNRVEFNIDYQGNVHPCCMDFANAYVLGNVHNESLASIWQRAKSQFQEHWFGNYTKSVCFNCTKLSTSV